MANAYTISLTAIDPGAATDPDLCLVSGNVRSIFGAPIPGMVLYVRHLYSPLALGSDTLILLERQQVKSDRTGAISFNLLRGATVVIELPNRPDIRFGAEVPDAASIDIADLILPYIASVAFDDSSPKAVAVGERFQLKTTATLSNGQLIDATPAVVLASSDSAIVLQESNGFFVALSAGSVTIELSSVDPVQLGIGVEPDGDTIVRVGVPATTFSADLVVNAA